MRDWNGERIGRMRDVINIELKQITIDDVGERIETWTLVGEFFANMDFRRRGSEKYEQVLQVSPQTTVECTIHSQSVPDISTANHRVVFKQKVYNIDSILPIEGEHRTLLELYEAERA